MDILKILEDYNFSPSTKIAAVIGDPIAQSLSPYLHNYLLKKHKIDGIYIPLKVSEVDFPKFLKTLPQLGFAGCNITIPHKEVALKLCDNLSESAKQIGAVNTIIFEKDGKIFGDNSDHFGFIANIKNTHPNFDFKNKKTLLLGAGGAARAIVFGLLKEQVGEIVVANRNLERAKILSENFKNVSPIHWNEREKNLEQFDIIVNSTSLGMQGKEELEIDLTSLKKTALVCDIVYKPLMTKLLVEAEKRGNPIVTGIGMLIFQGLIGFEKWFEAKPVVDQKLFDEMVHLSSKGA
ncbi:MAG: shikimate dehydrogenase [Rickettsiaceae bacterium]|jgi:shikimate dehydrogenase|nr:shikimate dehydrogenase [Rickettsiaceae bacterium]